VINIAPPELESDGRIGETPIKNDRLLRTVNIADKSCLLQLQVAQQRAASLFSVAAVLFEVKVSRHNGVFINNIMR
jgi:hypothetical protein